MSIITVIPDDELSIPDFLKREDTPEQKERREQLVKRLKRDGYIRRVSKSESGRSSISTGYAANLDETGKSILREMRQKGALSVAQDERARKALGVRGRSKMSKEVGPKEARRAELRVSKSTGKPVEHKPTLTEIVDNAMKNGHAVKKVPTGQTALKANGEAKKLPETTAPLADLPATELKKHKPAKETTTVKSAATKKRAAEMYSAGAEAARKARAEKAKPKSNGVNKAQIAQDMMLSKKGATREELEKATGWPTGLHMPSALARCQKTHPKAKLVEKDGRFWFSV